MNKNIKIALVAINAKYIHSSLAAYSLYAYLSKDEKKHVQIMEFTVNQSEEFIASELLRVKPDVLAFSCYIWNIDMVMSLVDTFKKVQPDMPIIAGGPEVSYEDSELPGVDIIVRGEGEEAFKRLVQTLCHCTPSPRHCERSEAIHHPTSSATDALLRQVKAFLAMTGSEQCRHSFDGGLDTIPFPYTTDFTDLQNRIIYYETSRGCVNRCGYCLSGSTTGIRFLSWERIRQDLDKFLSAKVKQVKFVDRTFNCTPQHATAIWQYLIQNDNGTTNFHFEIAGDLLTPDMMQLLKAARKGLFQFEIGVQSTNPQTLEAIRRKTNTIKIFENVNAIKKSDNIHLHLDLIVGLPYENYESFRQSFNDVFACRPHKLQIGFLKLLRGSRLRADADKYGIMYKNNAPYGVLQTNDISFEQINHLKKIEHMVETFYSAGGFGHAIEFMIQQFKTPFEFFDKLAIFWEENGYHLVSHKKMAMYSFLYKFGAEYLPDRIRLICELLKFNMLLQENIRTFPDWIENYYSYDNRLITRTAAVHTFDSDVCKWIGIPPQPRDITLNFDYSLPVDRGRWSCFFA